MPRNHFLPALVIPAYEPDEDLPDPISHLRRSFSRVVIVNDGSPRRYRPVFDKIKKIKGVVLLAHPTNLGKGAALKTAFRHVLQLDSHPGGVVTMDADGQHDCEDVRKVARALLRSPEVLHLGVRSFRMGMRLRPTPPSPRFGSFRPAEPDLHSQPRFRGDVPWKSRAGNLLTRRVFQFFTRLDLRDTQTGLRGIPLRLLPPLLGIRSNGFGFELEMLFEAVKRKVRIKEIPIRTIYAIDNQTSHFNSVKDSLKVYFVFLRRLRTRRTFEWPFFGRRNE